MASEEPKFEFNHSSLVGEANIIKEMILKSLVKEGVLSQNDYELFLKNYALALKKKGRWGKMLEDFFGVKDSKPDGYHWIVVKLIEHEG